MMLIPELKINEVNRLTLMLILSGTRFCIKLLDRIAYCVASSKSNKRLLNYSVFLMELAENIISKIKEKISSSLMFRAFYSGIDRVNQELALAVKLAICLIITMGEISNKKGDIYKGIFFIIGDKLEFKLLQEFNNMMLMVLTQRGDMNFKSESTNLDLLIFKLIYQWINYMDIDKLFMFYYKN